MKRALTCLALACACAGPRREAGVRAGPTAQQALVELSSRVGARRAEAKALLAAQTELYWRNWVYGDPIDVAATYRSHEALFTPASIAEVERLWKETPEGDERRALGFFRLYLTSEAVGRAVAPLSERIATLEAEATFVTLGGVEQPYRELDRLLANEVSYARRGQLWDAALPVVRELDPLLAQKGRQTRAVLAEVGFPSEAAFATQLRRADPEALRRLADGVLRDSDGLYRDAMDAALRADLGIGLAGMRRADLPRFDRNATLDAWFAANKLLPTLASTLAGMGIDLAKQSNLRIDDAPLPKKNPRAICFPVAVPGDIRISVKPAGGAADYQALFHEVGDAEHYAHTTVPLFELQQLGDDTVGPASPFLFARLVTTPRWRA